MMQNNNRQKVHTLTANSSIHAGSYPAAWYCTCLCLASASLPLTATACTAPPSAPAELHTALPSAPAELHTALPSAPAELHFAVCPRLAASLKLVLLCNAEALLESLKLAWDKSLASTASTASARACSWGGKGSGGDSSAARVRPSGKCTIVRAHLGASKPACCLRRLDLQSTN